MADQPGDTPAISAGAVLDAGQATLAVATDPGLHELKTLARTGAPFLALPGNLLLGLSGLAFAAPRRGSRVP